MIDKVRKKLLNLEKINLKTILDIFEYQKKYNVTYTRYLKHLGDRKVNALDQIPCLPITFFKTHQITCKAESKPLKTFLSSGTTSQTRSKHLIYDLKFYHQLSKKIFDENISPIKEYKIFALLPSYQENPSSSLIEMINFFIKNGQPGSGYIKYDDLPTLSFDGKILLFGVSFALLKAAEEAKLNLSGKQVKVIETGGMKGMRQEISRQELHKILKEGLGIEKVYSEYGMTELLSQAYTNADSGYFKAPTSMKVIIKDINDPFQTVKQGQVGKINIIDLANLDTCCFIETEDIGRMIDENRFEVLGRLDHSEIRGCNLLMAQ